MVRLRLVGCIFSSILVASLCAGCVTKAHTTQVRYDYPPQERPAPPTPIVDREQDPSSGVWPLGLWLTEFANRNGVSVQFRDQDTVNLSVVRPGPGPFDTEDEAVYVLRQVAHRNGLDVTEVRTHVYAVRHSIHIR